MNDGSETLRRNPGTLLGVILIWTRTAGHSGAECEMAGLRPQGLAGPHQARKGAEP